MESIATANLCMLVGTSSAKSACPRTPHPSGIFTVCVTKWENLNEEENGATPGEAVLHVTIRLVANAPSTLFHLWS